MSENIAITDGPRHACTRPSCTGPDAHTLRPIAAVPADGSALIDCRLTLEGFERGGRELLESMLNTHLEQYGERVFVRPDLESPGTTTIVFQKTVAELEQFAHQLKQIWREAIEIPSAILETEDDDSPFWMTLRGHLAG